MINDPVAVQFVNENVRRMLDWLVTLNNFSAACSANIPVTLTNTDDVVVDGSPADGRKPITGAQVIWFLNMIATSMSELQASGTLSAAQEFSVNPGTPDFTQEQ
jgi:hypothetical protein